MRRLTDASVTRGTTARPSGVEGSVRRDCARSLSGVSRQVNILPPPETHGAGDQVVPGDLVDQPEHLLADLPVARMPLWRRTQLDKMHRFARVELDHVAHAMTERDEVARLLREGIHNLAVGGFRLAHGHVPALSDPGVDNSVRNLRAQRRRR